MGIPKAAVMVDWEKFFDSIGRSVGFELMKALMPSGDPGRRYIEAEERFYAQAKFRFKIGKFYSAIEKTRQAGFPQGPQIAVQVAPAIIAMWSKAVGNQTKASPSDFIDDGSIRTKDCQDNAEAVETIQSVMRLLP